MSLTAGQQDQVWKAFMRIIITDPSSFTKTDLHDAVVAADSWADLNASSYNLALPVNFRTQATANQKAALLGLICWLRAGRPLSEGL